MLKNIITFIILFVLVLPILVSSQVATSTNYQIERDSINIGGSLSTSTNYGLQDTVGEVGTGEATSTNYTLLAGYQQPSDTFISITSPSDVNMDSISGLIGGSSASSVTWTVTTNSNAGYTLAIKADASPALDSATDSFADYTPAGANPDFTWSIATTDAEFGYSVESSDVVTRFKDNGSSCNTGSSNTNDSCWDAFTTSNVTISSAASANAPTGTETRVELQAESGTNKILESGDYSTVLTVTAVAL